ncbi:MAG TPA: SMC-Scp complex subunit ScpB [Oleiagrimonas sp.]|nr:SMC-Scp complex subunit ScpB [Oleiagrimonas sp.]
MDTIKLKQIIEAALLASTQPLTVPHLESLFAAEADDDPVSHEQIASALEALGDDCAERGVELIEVASGFRFQVRQDVHPWVARLWTERPSRYSRALLETLALIAYRQPITRGEIEQVRGVSVSSHITKTLEEREWIRVVGHRDTPGRPALFGTTRTFLDYFNIKSLDELPALADILNLEEIDPQLALNDDTPGAANVAAPEAAPPDDDQPAANDPADSDTAEMTDDSDAPASDPDETIDADAAAAPDEPEAAEPTTDSDADAPDDTATTGTDSDTATAADENPEENRA